MSQDPITIVGAGVIGLSIAYDLVKQGCNVRIVESGQPGMEASWAGAGILAPSTSTNANHPYDQLRALSWATHPGLAQELLADTGIDNGFHTCGGITIARTLGEAAMLQGYLKMLHDEAIEAEEIVPTDLPSLEPFLNAQAIKRAVLIPSEAQLRNPRHLKALSAACLARGVEIISNAGNTTLQTKSGSIVSIELSDGRQLKTSAPVCVAAGAWSQAILQQIGISTGVLPIRGQMVLFQCGKTRLSRIIAEGPRYLVPRDDGRILVGSTEEEVGFVKETTEEAREDLREFATDLVPALKEETIERTWAGLRPASFDGLPYLGRLPELDNGFIAAGHFRSGLFLSAATAIVMSQAIRGMPIDVDLTPFRVSRA